MEVNEQIEAELTRWWNNTVVPVMREQIAIMVSKGFCESDVKLGVEKTMLKVLRSCNEARFRAACGGDTPWQS